ncbi:monooxygenase [Halomonas sp. SSL-5]|uniref:monooxygenase n=1 Tax=Halomonas sp. SSL-5 TaxID=3065855 RepID=UPI002739A486|nr:monooxygenase [Halomonas sp. SSL-5]MDY7115558.1 monooxygenase [Halomonas sp. SSL-5]
MAVILQVHFPFDGPFGEAMVEAMTPLARSINDEPGLLWKIWTEDEQAGRAGGVYLFATREDAEAYRRMHTARLEGMGVAGIEAQILEANEALSAINGGPLPGFQ